MPAKSPTVNAPAREMMEEIGRTIRGRRKALGVSTVMAAHAAGVSRVTWHRVEKAEPSVTLGAYVAALQTLGLGVQATQASAPAPNAFGHSATECTIAAGIAINRYPQLREIAWHVKDGFVLTPTEAWGLYDRYRRHLRLEEMQPDERKLYDELEKAAI
jgi:DNA-binding XRE family transcriptional regulator